MAPDDHPGRHETPARIAMWSLVAVIMVNAVAYASAVSNPLIYSDNWTFIDTFLRVAIEEGVGFGDFLVKRAGVDHAQPLTKLLMLVNYRWFGLDFRLESHVAMAFAVAGWIVMLRVAMRDRAGTVLAGADAWTAALLLGALAAVHLSLNGVAVYTYPMVTMAHAFYLCALVMIHCAWAWVDGGKAWPLLLSTLLCGIVGDDSAILLGMAVGLALLLYGWRSGRRAQALRALLLIAVVLLACRGLYAAFGEIRGTTNPDFNVGLDRRIAGLLGQWRDAWQWIAIPLSSGIAALDALQSGFGAHWQAARNTLAVLVLSAHLWFWRSALRTRVGPLWFLAIALMLMFYAHLAGILLGRVFVRGTVFLEQPRYVVFYQLGMVALLLMAIAALHASPSRLRQTGFAVVALALLIVQVPLSMSAWRQADAYRQHYVAMARDMGNMARDPLHPPAGCTSGVDICHRPEATRVRLMRMLVQHRINLFSPQFQARHPDLAAAVGPYALPPSNENDTARP